MTCSKSSPISWLAQSSVLIRAHFISDGTEHLFNSHVTVPVSNCIDLVRNDNPRFGVHARHVDFANKSDFWRNRGVLFRAVDSQFIEAPIVLGLDNVVEG